MSLSRWQPFSEVVSLRDAMDRLFEETFFQPTRTGRGGGMTVPIDMHETDKEIVIRAPMPGVKPEEVEITISGDALTIRGEIKRDESVKRENFLYQEWRYGQFARAIPLPKPVQADRAEARFENGVLTLTLPKAEEAKVRRIEVKQGGARQAS